MTLTIELSWPSPILWPNARVYRLQKSSAARAARDEGYICTLAALEAGPPPPLNDRHGDIPVRIVGHKPAERGQDRDNFQAALKSQLDGIAAALGVNDKKFKPSVEWGEPRPFGGVTITVGR